MPLCEISRCFRDASNEARWTNETPIPQHFFALNSEFDLNRPLDESPIIQTASASTIIEITSVIDSKLRERVKADPRQVYLLDPRQFEELLAEIFAGFGFEIELTARTRDGGRDVIAISHEIVRAKYLIECKRYRDKKVEVGTVQKLHGVTVNERATKGILVTTSRFTKPAEHYMEQNKWVLEGRDYDGLVSWLEMYQNLEQKRLVENVLKKPF
jgi:HJR/Mrr/RecB family endonuclease